MRRENPDLDVDYLFEHPLIAETLEDGCSTADLAGVLRELGRLGEWTLGGHDDLAERRDGSVEHYQEVVCTVRLRGEPEAMIVASGPHALAAALRCLLSTLRHVQRAAEEGLAELLGLADSDA